MDYYIFVHVVSLAPDQEEVMSHTPPDPKIRGLRIGHRLIIIRNGRFVGKRRKKGSVAAMSADRKEALSAPTR
jgi:hypothetical protein